MRRLDPAKGNAPEVAATGASDSETPHVSKESEMDSTPVSVERSIAVPFHGAELSVVSHDGQPYAPMKPIVEGMGLSWQPQHRKLTANESRWGVINLSMQDDLNHHDGDAGQRRLITCVPLRKLPGWLASLEPSRIKKPEVRARVVQYQNECDDALWEYWTNGAAINPRVVGDLSTVNDRLPLYFFTVDTVIKHRLLFSKVYLLLNLFAGSKRFKDMTKDQVAEVADFCDRFALAQDTRTDWQRIVDNQSRLHGTPKQLDMVQQLLIAGA